MKIIIMYDLAMITMNVHRTLSSMKKSYILTCGSAMWGNYDALHIN